MNKKRKLIFLGVLAVVIVGILSFSFTKAFMKPLEQSTSITEVSLTSCAKIKLTSESSINLTNSYSMSANSALKQTPYTFSITSYCGTPVTADIMFFSKSTNTISESDISYIIAPHGAKEVLYQSALPDSRYGFDYSLTSAETSEVSAGMGGSVGERSDIYQVIVPNKGTVTLDLYLYVNEESDNTTMGKTFEGAVAVKANARDVQQMDSVCKNGDALSNCLMSMRGGSTTGTGLYLHNSSISTGAQDNSYRYAGADPDNYVCFGTNVSPCPSENLYRAIGVFNLSNTYSVKLIKADLASAKLLGTDGAYNGPWSVATKYEHYIGKISIIDQYEWGPDNNTWSSSSLNTVNLNNNFLNNIGTVWADKIKQATWIIGGGALSESDLPANMYSKEMTTNASTTYTGKVGLMYASEYLYAASQKTTGGWTVTSDNYDSLADDNWLALKAAELTLSRFSNDAGAIMLVNSDGELRAGAVSDPATVRPAFYLNSTVKFVQGLGTLEAPIIIE